MKKGISKNTRRAGNTPPTAGRPRDEEATEAILKAALELGEELGFEGITVEGVAARAGVGKSTIYRRWANAWAIVAEAFFADAMRLAPIEQRGTVRQSFLASMLLVARSFRGRHGKILRPLIGRAQTDAGLRRALGEHWLQPRREVAREMIRKGMASGELRAGLDPDVVLDALYGAFYHRLLLPYEGEEVRLSEGYVEKLVETVFGGLEG